MDAVSAVSSVLTVIELSAKLASICLEYSTAVKNAKPEILRLRETSTSLGDPFKSIKKLTEGPHRDRLQHPESLHNEIQRCEAELKELKGILETKLNSKSDKTMRRFGLRALQWPFESKEVEKRIAILEQSRRAVSDALNIDQTGEIFEIAQRQVLANLPIIQNAEFDSESGEHTARCHPLTRVALRQDIQKWAEDPESKCIFWLHGMAGTGKSTISRTVAQEFADNGCLGASFFFKRGEKDRSNARRLFTTIAFQLMYKEPALAPHVRTAIDINPTISAKGLKEQFEQLILGPLGTVKGNLDIKIFIIVIDALDECEGDQDIQTIIRLLSRGTALASVRLKAFLTSRPELPIRLGFGDIEGKYQELVLHKIPPSIVESDIAAFLESRLAEIRVKHNFLFPRNELSLDWPGPFSIQKLAQMAVPLFIFATTICRFIEDRQWSNPAERLEGVLKYQAKTQNHEIDKLDATYLPVFDSLLVGQLHKAKEDLVKEFQMVIGTIVLLAEPLSVSSLASLLDIEEFVIERRLSTLHSVLDVPDSAETPVRICHLSLRDFLIDSNKRDTNPFWIDEDLTHEMIATRCLTLLSSHDNLKEDICDLKDPGSARADVPSSIVDEHLPSDVRYACLHWVYHTEQSKASINDTHQVYIFLKCHFLHWLEALSLLGKISESIHLIRSLQILVGPDTNTDVSAFLNDATRFIPTFRPVVDLCPLQVYVSAVYFAPLKSPIRNLFQTCIPKWILLGPEIDADWDSCLQTFEGHTDPVEDVAFSPGGNIIASAGDSTVRIWDTTIGDEKFTLKGDGEHVTTVKVSPSSGSILASGYVDGSVRLWDTATGEENLVLTGHDGYISALAFSSDGTRVASGSWDRKILVWDISTGETSLVLKGHERVSAIAFSIDDRTVASGAKDGSITIWDIATGEERLVLKGHKEKVTVLAFTADDKTMASASGDGTVRLWDTSTDEELLVFDGHDGCVSALVFLPNGKIASASCFNNVQIWDMWTGKANQSFETGLSRCAAFSPNGRIFASGLRDGTIRLRDIAIAEKEQNAEFFGVFALSPDGKTGVSEEGESIQLWDVTTGKKKGTLKGHIWDARDLIFSPNSKFIASSSWNDPAVQVWNVATGNHNWKLDWPRTEKIIFSPDSKTIALMRKDKILLLNAVTGGMTRMISNGDGRCFRDFAFFSNKTMIVLYHQGNLELFNTVTGKRKKWMKFKQSSFICDRFNFSWSKNLAVYHWKKVIILQNLTTQKVLRTIVLEHPVSALSFSADGQYLNVGRGMLNLSPDSADKQQETTNSPIFITRDWVLRDGKRLLWLPPNFRTEKLEFQDNTFMFEHSFRVGFFRFEYP